MAQTIANGAIAKCQSMGFKISVSVLDRGGLALVMLRDEGAGLHTVESSDRKAYTARTFRQPSASVVKRILDDPAVAGFKEYTRVIALAGGLPIKIGDDVIGAVGVSGSPGKDDDCAQAGIDKVADQLQVKSTRRPTTRQGCAPSFEFLCGSTSNRTSRSVNERGRRRARNPPARSPCRARS